MKKVSISLIPRPPPFFCSLVCIRHRLYMEVVESLETVIMCMISGGLEVDVGGRVLCSNNILDFIVQLSVTRQGPIHSQIWQETRSQVYCTSTCSQAPPQCPPNLMYVIHVSVPRPSPFFASLLLSCIMQ